MATITATRDGVRQAAGQPVRRRPDRGFGTAGGHVVRTVLALFFGLPILFMLVSSLKPDDQIFADLSSPRAFLPVGDISLANYAEVFRTVPAWRFLANSIGISALTVVLGVLINSLAAFALTRMRWRGRGLVLTLIIATLVVPFETFALPLLWWANKLPWLVVQDGRPLWTFGWLDSYQVQIIPFVANAFSIYLYYSYLSTIPKELDEAARIDGANWFRIYRSIILPLAGPATATVAILTFLNAWNQFLWPLMSVQSEDLRPVMVGVQYFFQLDVAWGPMMAYATLITIPVLVLFLSFQRAFIGSIASSGVKG
ncbi:carbohydrate ABC transporter permease [Lentzea aerocolonigenes]|uniref:carbohydrate ABC transporter permease n=1 Tax=Lentzea aerocolonigenes TaxID=68170 RepID=UPI0004C39111|nr:carbohydrate ABC transporter permease [Lentzea aerocolonigenes]MCP2242694.1 multiple sugar transport system permease protein [Lentzea aerocolonigenes]